MKYNTADRETGTIIDTFATREEAVKAIERYEEEDKREGSYTPDFYDIVDDDHCAIGDPKYWLDCDSNAGTQFALYQKIGEGEKCILRFGFDDIDGLKELEEAGKIGEGYELIDRYIEKELGFLPEYEVG